jgi:exodeoxyribonuclease V alpha subunit
MELAGTVERLTFHNAETQYAVLRLRLEGGGQASVVGHFPPPAVGEEVRFTGEWVSHPTYGRQFRAGYYELCRPSTLAGIERYLASGVVKGIGPALAARLVERFGVATLEVMEKDPERLREVPGIGPAKAEAIRQAFAGQAGLREAMVFLQGHGIGPAAAARIYRTYGADAVALIRENPYRLAEEVFGVGFKTADRLARSLGLAADAPARIEAGLAYLLRQGAGEGHLYVPLPQLVREGAALLAVTPGRVRRGC